MNILHVVCVSFSLPYFIGEQVRYFLGKGYREYVVCSPDDNLEALAQQYGFEYHTECIERKISILSDLRALWGICRYIRQQRIDIVVGHTPKGALLAMIAAYITRVPKRIYFRHGLVYQTATGFKRKLLMFLDRLTSRLATKIVSVSPSVSKQSVEDGLNPAHKQTLLCCGTCNGVNTERFCRDNIAVAEVDALRRELNISADDFVVGFTGRLVKDKGIVELVAAFKLFAERCSGVKLLLVGVLEQRDALPEDVVSQILENDNIIFTGAVENRDIHRYYALMNIFILPSYREGFPTSALEASAMSLPVVTTRVTGCVDAIVEGRTGLFVSHDVEDIAGVLEHLYNHRQLCTELGVGGREFVTSSFRQQKIWEEIEKLYL
ncbi:MAG: glycosyltransferase family 4 protein [Alistipes sp.]|nr:glycosyltransferase family 4 protein [Alistipes sp.]